MCHDNWLKVFWEAGNSLLTALSNGEKRLGELPGILIRALIPLLGLHLHKLIAKPLLLTSSVPGIRISPYELEGWRCKHSESTTMGACGKPAKDYADSTPSHTYFWFFSQQSKEDFPDLKKHMWLDKVKNRLNKKAYHSVKHFVADMRLIFRNHSIFYKVRASALLSFSLS